MSACPRAGEALARTSRASPRNGAVDPRIQGGNDSPETAKLWRSTACPRARTASVAPAVCSSSRVVSIGLGQRKGFDTTLLGGHFPVHWVGAPQRVVAYIWL